MSTQVIRFTVQSAFYGVSHSFDLLHNAILFISREPERWVLSYAPRYSELSALHGMNTEQANFLAERYWNQIVKETQATRPDIYRRMSPGPADDERELREVCRLLAQEVTQTRNVLMASVNNNPDSVTARAISKVDDLVRRAARILQKHEDKTT